MQPELALNADSDAVAPNIGAEALFRAHAAFVASFLRHMGATESDVDDVVQDVFVLAHRKGGYQPGPAAPRTWLASLAIRVFIGRRRATARRQLSSVMVDTLPDHASGPVERLEARRSLERVQAALAHLSLEHRAAFVLFEIEGESCQSIAAMWEVPLGTIYSRLHHARKHFLAVYELATRRDANRKDES